MWTPSSAGCGAPCARTEPPSSQGAFRIEEGDPSRDAAVTDRFDRRSAPDRARLRDGQRDVLRTALGRWLRAEATDGSAAARVTAMLALMERWRGVRADSPRHGLEQLLDHLRTDADARRWLPASAREFAPAFAGALIDRAIADVEREAFRAGHGRMFAALRPDLERGAGPPGLASGTIPPDLPAAALPAALRRLRHRFRQRIDAGLALWSASPAQQGALRRELLAALSKGEPSP